MGGHRGCAVVAYEPPLLQGAALSSLWFVWDCATLLKQLQISQNALTMSGPYVVEADRQLSACLVEDERTPTLPPDHQAVSLQLIQRLANGPGIHTQLLGEIYFVG